MWRARMCKRCIGGVSEIIFSILGREIFFLQLDRNRIINRCRHFRISLKRLVNCLFRDYTRNTSLTNRTLFANSGTPCASAVTFVTHIVGAHIHIASGRLIGHLWETGWRRENNCWIRSIVRTAHTHTHKFV